MNAWHEHALAAVSEGICPQHSAPLIPSAEEYGNEPAGWCGPCCTWWLIAAGSVVRQVFPWDGPRSRQGARC